MYKRRDSKKKVPISVFQLRIKYVKNIKRLIEYQPLLLSSLSSLSFLMGAGGDAVLQEMVEGSIS